MKTPEVFDDVLFQVERRIARRADELDRLFGVHPGHALEHWRQAEQEVWDGGDHGAARERALVPG